MRAAFAFDGATGVRLPRAESRGRNPWRLIGAGRKGPTRRNSETRRVSANWRAAMPFSQDNVASKVRNQSVTETVHIAAGQRRVVRYSRKCVAEILECI